MAKNNKQTKKMTKKNNKKEKRVQIHRKTKKNKLFNIPNYAQKEEFTSSAACALMVLGYLNKKTQMKKENEFKIWRETVSGSVWHGSRYGLAYALAKRGARPEIITNTADEGFERRIAVYEGININTLSASFNEIKNKTRDLNIKESVLQNIDLGKIKEQINNNRIPIVLVNANELNPYMEKSPHWVVVKGYDNDSIYINDPYQDNTVVMTQDLFKKMLGYENNIHIISVNARKFNK
ncbi:MAG: C39 family peptidase [Candidatus Marsarchaeota archaeon]|nr:C39 family peptidase [Candidatus Marsarchaeota archaeon]MCL5094609.1 C39 family peptidase [Candidatus Marsarchaeota archaeon]